MPMNEFLEEKCRPCPDHRINGGRCTGPGDIYHACPRIQATERGVLLWINRIMRMPTADDADPWGDVIIWDALNGLKLTQYDNRAELERPNVTHFARTPPGPMREVRI